MKSSCRLRTQRDFTCWGAATSDYPYQPVPLNQVSIRDGLQKLPTRFETNRRVAVWANFRKSEETARIANFARRQAGKGRFRRHPVPAIQTSLKSWRRRPTRARPIPTPR